MKYRSIYVIGLIIMLSAIELRMYTSHIYKQLENQNWETIIENTDQQLFNFEENIRTDVMVVENYTHLLGEGLLKGEVSELLTALSENTNFEFFSYATLDGSMVYPNEITVDVNDRDYFLEVKADHTSVISEPIPSKIRDKNIIAIATPLFFDNDLQGMLVGTYDSSYLNQAFHSAFDQKEFIFIINEKNELVATTDENSHLLRDDFFVVIEESKILDGKTYQDLVEDIHLNEEGSAEVLYQGEKYYLYFKNSTINKWKIFTLVPASQVTMYSDSIINASWFVVFSIFIMYLLFFLYRFSVQKKSIREIKKLLYFDKQTGLPTVHKFLLDVDELQKYQGNEIYACSKVDIVNFKIINELFGFEVGDYILKEVASILGNKAVTKTIKASARIGQDEFLVVKVMQKNRDIAHELELELSRRVAHLTNDSKIEFRIGRTLYTRESNMTIVIEEANIAHSQCKKMEGCKELQYNGKMKQQLLKESILTRGMHKGIEEKEFKLYLQPKVNPKDHTVKGFEALVRWEKDGTMISPYEFIALFERNHFIKLLDYYMFEQVCMYLREEEDQGRILYPISVNFSKHHLHVPTFVDDIVNLIRKYDIDPMYLEVELTESTIFEDLAHINQVIEHLHFYGFKVSMDDFGSGSSSLGMLSNIEVDIIKLDRSFFVNLKNPVRTKLLLENIIKFAIDLGLSVVAEGVEDEEMVYFLRDVNCHLIQSFYYSKPLPKEKVYQYLKEKGEFQ